MTAYDYNKNGCVNGLLVMYLRVKFKRMILLHVYRFEGDLIEEVVLCKFVTVRWLPCSAVEGNLYNLCLNALITSQQLNGLVMYVASYDCSHIYIVCCSYSHCVFTIKLVQTSNAAKPTCARGNRVSIVDLACSEWSTLVSL